MCVCLSVTTLASTYISRLYVENTVLYGIHFLDDIPDLFKATNMFVYNLHGNYHSCNLLCHLHRHNILLLRNNY